MSISTCTNRIKHANSTHNQTNIYARLQQSQSYFFFLHFNRFQDNRTSKRAKRKKERREKNRERKKKKIMKEIHRFSTLATTINYYCAIVHDEVYACCMWLKMVEIEEESKMGRTEERLIRDL